MSSVMLLWHPLSLFLQTTASNTGASLYLCPYLSAICPWSAMSITDAFLCASVDTGILFLLLTKRKEESLGESGGDFVEEEG